MLNPSEVADTVELHQLAYRYAAAVDSCDVGAFLSIFCPEARVSTFAPGADKPFGVNTGHDELADIPRAMRKLFTRTAHLMTNHLVELEGDVGSGSVLCTARHFYANAAGGTDLVVVIRYIDRYERREDRWLILDREIRFLWSETHATLTDEQIVAVLHGH
jgi:3-phenylpropionate/cinnamic acid dioxygenase small subunit